MNVSSHSAITCDGTVLLNWILLVAKVALELACWPPAATKGALYPNSCPCVRTSSTVQSFEIQNQAAHPTLQ